MKSKIWMLCCCLLAGTVAFAQEQDVATLQETAKAFTRDGDYANAVVVLNRGLAKEPGNLNLLKDLAINYYLQHNYTKALETAKPLADREDADVQSFQILGMTYKAIEEKKEAEKMYKKALKKFPDNGALHNEYGELLWSKDDFSDAVKQWEQGIQGAPSYAGNYYNAAKYYYFSKDKVWSIVYGEIFINMESYSQRTPEIKKLLLDSYQKLFSDADLTKSQDMKNNFVKAFLETVQKNASVMSKGITPESISVLRTRFVLDWFKTYASQFPLRLFDQQQQLLKLGIFDAYNQWIFGAAADLTTYQNWIGEHSEEYDKLSYFQKNRVFKIPEGQYYQNNQK